MLMFYLELESPTRSQSVVFIFSTLLFTSLESLRTLQQVLPNAELQLLDVYANPSLLPRRPHFFTKNAREADVRDFFCSFARDFTTTNRRSSSRFLIQNTNRGEKALGVGNTDTSSLVSPLLDQPQPLISKQCRGTKLALDNNAYDVFP